MDWVHDARNTWYDNFMVDDSVPWPLPHQIVIDQNGFILPWFSSDLGVSYNHVINLLWNYWKNSPVTNGFKNYMQYRIAELTAGADADQFTEALSSWRLLYQYSGNADVLEDMIYIADFYLNKSYSPTALWLNVLYTSNSDRLNGDVYSSPGRPISGNNYFYGDLIRGEGFARVNVAGHLGSELIPLYKITGNKRYLTAAINIANTLADKVQPGDGNNSPLPFRINVNTGQITDPYTSDWTGALRLFDQLIEMGQGNVSGYNLARTTISTWFKNYPMKTNKWGPTFSDVVNWSNTEINADSLAWYILENPWWDQNWKQEVRKILDSTERIFGNPTWNGTNWGSYGVLPINEQTEYPMPGNSHTARHGSVEVIYAQKTGDNSKKPAGVRELSWATYMVDSNGANIYPENKIWYEDGYGDFVRHYLRAMAAAPELAPANENHFLDSTSVIKNIIINSDTISYQTFDAQSQDLLRITFQPAQVIAGSVNLTRLDTIDDLRTNEGYTYNAPGDVQGVLRIKHNQSGSITINATRPLIPGDVNHDGRVDILDLRQLFSGFTNIFDYNLVVGNFGRRQ